MASCEFYVLDRPRREILVSGRRINSRGLLVDPVMNLLALLLLSVTLIKQVLHRLERSGAALRADVVPLLEEIVKQIDKSLLPAKTRLQIGQFLLRDVHDLPNQLIFGVQGLRILADYS